MKRSLLWFAAALTALFISGCVTSTLKYTPAAPGSVSRSGAPVTYIVDGMNTGVYLFYFIPLWTGNPYHPNQRDYDLLEHRIDDKEIYRLFDVAVKRKHATRYEDVSITYYSSGIWTLWIIWKRSVHGRAVLVREKKRRDEKRSQ